MRTGSRTLFVWLPRAARGAHCALLSTERFPAKRRTPPGRLEAGRGLSVQPSEVGVQPMALQAEGRGSE